MKLIVECQRCIDEARTLFDFMSMAMDKIDEINPDYVSLNSSVNGNKKLKSFIDDVTTGIFDSKNHFLIFPETKKIVNELISEIDFLTEKDPKNSALVLYSVLLSIDSKFNYNSNHIKKLGPLDKNPNHRFRLYRYISTTLIDPFIVDSHKERVSGSSVCRSFKNYFFLDRASWGYDKAVPEGFPVESPLDNGCKNSVSRPIRIGVSLFCSERNFDFVSDISGDLTIDYCSKDQERFCNMVDKILEKAIKNDCDFLIFPEYHTSQAVLEQIEKHLKNAYDNNRNTPILTFAGSQWTSNNSNQMTIFGKKGKFIKKYQYNKYAPFKGAVDTSELVNRLGEPWETDEIEVTENLKNRDKNLVFFGLNNFGTILPAICKDAYADDYTEVLAQCLHPLFVFISAWSTSLNSFRAPLKNMCCRYFVSSVLANACSAIKMDRKDVGYCNTVHKPDTVPDERSEIIERPCIGCDHCDSGCLYIAEYRFGYHVDDGTPDGHFEEPTLDVQCKVIK